MWATNNITPYNVERSFVRDLDGGEVWVVVLVATFNIHPDGTTTPSDQQQPVCLSPKHAGKPGRSSLLREPDLVLRKRGTDIVVDGKAYAPHGKPAGEVPIALAVGPLRKALLVTGDRQCINGTIGTVTHPRPFIEMPIRYENAYGGMDVANPTRCCLANPAGKGYASEKRKLTLLCQGQFGRKGDRSGASLPIGRSASARPS